MLTACFTIAVLTYSVCGALLARGWEGRGAGLLLLAAVAGTWLWAVTGLVAASVPGGLTGWLELVNGLRAALWIWLVLGILGLARTGLIEFIEWRRPLFRVALGLAAVKLGSAALVLLADESGPLRQVDRAFGLALAVFGLLLVENVYSATDRSARWAIKHLLIAAGFMFTFDMFRYSDALLIRQFSDVAQVAQSLVSAMVAPLLVVAAARIRSFAIIIHVARRFVLQTSALVFSGAYLLAVAVAGSLLRQLDLTWGPALQIASLVGAVVLLALLLSSGQARAHGRRLVERSFFSFAYDYREEWLRFVATMAGGEAGTSGLHERAIRAAAEPLDCSAGLLYLRDRHGCHRCAAEWNWRAAAAGSPPPAAVVATLEAGAATVVDLRDPATLDGTDRLWPDRPKGAWMLLGLRSRDRCQGILLLGQPRVARRLTWEDYDLLGIFAAEIGGYLAEELAARSLAEAQRFEAIGKSFSFVAHDLKNVVTQLSLLLQQAKRHGDKPEFMQDTLLTVGESVEKMQTVLLRLRDGRSGSEPRPVELVGLLEGVAMHRRLSGRAVQLRLPEGPVVVEAEPEALATLVENLADNAHEAGGDSVQIELSLATSDGRALIELRDDGPGMSRQFIEEHLFKPFASAKPAGFGIGLYQCREWAERWGGRLEVTSTPGAGTSVHLSLALLPAEFGSPEGRESRSAGMVGA